MSVTSKCVFASHPGRKLTLPQGWTSRLSSTDLITDRRAGLEVIETIQSFLDGRAAKLPDHIRSMRQQKLREEESHQSEFDSIGIDFTTDDLAMLGADVVHNPIVEQEKELANVSRAAMICALADINPDHRYPYLSRYLRASLKHVLLHRPDRGGRCRRSGYAELDFEAYQVLGRLCKRLGRRSSSSGT